MGEIKGTVLFGTLLAVLDPKAVVSTSGEDGTPEKRAAAYTFFDGIELGREVLALEITAEPVTHKEVVEVTLSGSISYYEGLADDIAFFNLV